jgi:hypothetical protein
VNEYYDSAQHEDDLGRYRKIVEFHDGKNSERIMNLLIRDGVLEAR